MTDEQVRELFSAALEDQLDAQERADFDALLATRPELTREFEALRATLLAASETHRRAPVPDLLPGVQSKLRNRGRKGLGDGTAHLRGRGFLSPVGLGIVLCGLLLLLWLAARLTLSLEP